MTRALRAGLGTLAAVGGIGAALVAGGAASADQAERGIVTSTTNPTTSTTTTTGPPPAVQTIYMRGKGRNLRFDYEGLNPNALIRGADLEVVNETSPEQVGPHTFTLLQKRTIDRATSERPGKCFRSGICGRIAGWHEFDPQTGAVGRQLVEAGRPGWSRKGSLKRVGDSWYTETEGEEFQQELSSGHKRLRFFCAIHPQMNGAIRITDQPTR